jgi:hypothetical protein
MSAELAAETAANIYPAVYLLSVFASALCLAGVVSYFLGNSR